MYERHGWPINAKITKLTTSGQRCRLVLFHLLSNPFVDAPCTSESSSQQLRGIVRRGGYILSAQFRAHLIKLRASPRSRETTLRFSRRPGPSLSLPPIGLRESSFSVIFGEKRGWLPFTGILSYRSAIPMSGSDQLLFVLGKAGRKIAPR